jgi:hypothetical protein
MSEREKEKMLELLSDQTVFGLSDEELAELAELEKNYPGFETEAESLEAAAAAVGMMNLETSEPLPAHLRAKVMADADQYFAARGAAAPPVAAAENKEEEIQKTFAFEPKSSIRQWLGWAVAGAACVALAINLYTTRPDSSTIVRNPTPTPAVSPKPELTLAEQREQLLASAPDVVQSAWTDLDPKKPRNVQGDVVWSNSVQKGYVRFRGLPANDKAQETYQIWIFDKAQKNPISGGVFDIDANGEVVVPIDSAIRVQEPTMFGVTAEKPGGVMVSELKKVMAVAKLAA